MAAKLFYRPFDSIIQCNFRFPAEGMSARRIHQFAIHPIRFGRIPADFSLESGCGGDLFGEFFDRDIGTVSNIDDFRFTAVLHEEINGICNIIHMKEFAERFPRAPEDFFRTVFLRRLDKPSDQRREDMPVYKVVGVIRAIEIAGHQADGVPAILFAEVKTEFITGDFCQSVALIGGLQRTGQQVFFLDRLRRLAWIDATGSEETELFHFMQKTLHDHVVLDLKVFEQELRAMRFVCHDPADFCPGENHIVRPLRIEELLDRLLIAEIEFGMSPFLDIGVAFLFEFADACAADHAAMAADKDFGIFVDHNTTPQKPIS